jgi:hypothetical protein
MQLSRKRSSPSRAAKVWALRCGCNVAADAHATVAVAQEVLENLGGLRTRTLLAGVGPQDLMAARPDEWRAAVTRFLDEASARPVETGA